MCKLQKGVRAFPESNVQELTSRIQFEFPSASEWQDFRVELMGPALFSLSESKPYLGDRPGETLAARANPRVVMAQQFSAPLFRPALGPKVDPLR